MTESQGDGRNTEGETATTTAAEGEPSFAASSAGAAQTTTAETTTTTTTTDTSAQRGEGLAREVSGLTLGDASGGKIGGLNGDVDIASTKTSASPASSSSSPSSSSSSAGKQGPAPPPLPQSFTNALPRKNTATTARAAALSSVKLPPSLQAKMQAQVAAHGNLNGFPTGASSSGMLSGQQKISGWKGPQVNPPFLSPVPQTQASPTGQPSSPTGKGGLAGQGRIPSGGLKSGMRAPPPRLNPMMTSGLSDSSNSSPSSDGRPSPVGGGSMAARRGLKLPPGGLSGGPLGSLSGKAIAPTDGPTPFSNFSKIVDPSGRLKFGGKAVIHAKGVDFSNGSSFNINMDELNLMEELGKGNYGTVQKVYHKPTNVTMAMKEIRLELDEAKLNAIIMELEILHRATGAYIIEFYGAFFIESCVYYCMEFMDAGSLDKLYGDGVPEDVLARITYCIVQGLRFLKDELQIIHRDVKPTNVLINRAGEVKLCDFGVSGQLEKSLAKTNIGCQSYMAPERIHSEASNAGPPGGPGSLAAEGAGGTYTVASDVWSLGLALLETSTGRYPYPPETYNNIFAQLTAIVHGEPPKLPNAYSDIAKDFVARCLIKNPKGRPNYAQLLEHPFLRRNAESKVDMKGWVSDSLAAKEAARSKSPT